MDSRKRKIGGALTWKLSERLAVQCVQLAIQVLLARMLGPAHYGMLAILLAFTGLANVFVQTGFSTALVRNKDVNEADYSSVFCMSTLVAAVAYGLIFAIAPTVGEFYDMPELVAPLRVIALVLFPGALNAVQQAKVSRELNFRVVFISNLVAVAVSGAVGIAIACNGGGLWALVAQSVLNVTVASSVMLFTVRWRPRFQCDFLRVKVLFSFGWKLLAAGLLDAIYHDLSSLVMGKKYSSETLGYYNRGRQFPQVLINAVNGTVQSVMLPVMSAQQDDRQQLKQTMRRSVILSSYLIFPVMAGLAAVATPLVELLLTEKWLPCVPYLRVFCFSLAFYPVHSCNLQAINAVGRSDVFLKLAVIKRTLGCIMLVTAVVLFSSPMAVALTSAVATLINCFINAGPNKKLIGYAYREQMSDILPSALAALAMMAAVLPLGTLPLSTVPLLTVQVAAGVVIYVSISAIFGLAPFRMLCEAVQEKLTQRREHTTS